VGLEEVEEVFEEEVFVDISANMLRELLHETHIFFRLNGVVFVMLPVVLKILLKSLCHLLRKRTILVKMGEETQPFT
jgi:hypothetical protein